MTTKTEQFDETAQEMTTVNQGGEPIHKTETTGATVAMYEALIESEEEMTEEEFTEYLKVKYAYVRKTFTAGQVIYSVRLSRDPHVGFEDIRVYTIRKVTDKSYITDRGRVIRGDIHYEYFENVEEAKVKWKSVVNEEIAHLQEQIRVGPEIK